MHINSIVAGAAIALTAMVSPAVADGETGLKEVQGFSVLSSVSADRLTDREMTGLRGASALFVQTGSGMLVEIPLAVAVISHMCGGISQCVVNRGRPQIGGGGL